MIFEEVHPLAKVKWAAIDQHAIEVKYDCRREPGV